MSTRQWIDEKDSESNLCPFGPKPDFKNGNEEFKTSNYLTARAVTDGSVVNAERGDRDE